MSLKAIIGAVCIVLVLVVCASGCTNPTQTAQSTTAPTSAPSSNKAIDYANAMIVDMKLKVAAKNQTMTSTKIMANGSNGARFTVTQVDNSNVKTQNSQNATVAVTVKAFSNKDDASAFFDNATFGYTKDTAASMATFTYYKIAFGHNATINDGALKVESAFPVKASQIIQQDEFVSIWNISGV